MARYTAIEPLLTKAGRVEPGESVELSDKQAKPLLEMGAIEPLKGRAARSASRDAEAERLAAEAAEAEALAQADADAAAQAERLAAEAVQAAQGAPG